MYRVIKAFTDLKDNNHAYSVGDLFPHDGVEVDADRLSELASSSNKLGVSLIEEIEEKRPQRKRKKAKEN